MIAVMLYGHLAKKFGRRINLEVKTPAEAVRALCTIMPGFKRHIQENSEPGYKVIVGQEERDKDGLHNPVGGAKTLKIVPVVAGSGAVGRIILGVVMLVISYFFPVMAWWNGYAYALIVGGVAEMIFTTPKSQASGSNEAANNKPSYAFDGAVNTAAQGNPVPLCYGRMIVGSQVVSAGLSVEQIA